MYIFQHTIILSAIFLLTSASTIVRLTEKLEDDKIYDEIETHDGPPIPFSLEEIYRGKFSAKYFNGTWISPTEILYLQQHTRNILKFDVQTLQSNLFFKSDILEELSWSTYSLSADGRYLLIGYDTVGGFRHSVHRKYMVYNIVDKSNHKIAKCKQIQLATWAPVGNGLVYVLDNDIYYRYVTGNSIKVRRLTFDGAFGVIYNGVPDWVYEEEVLGAGSALWFSPDGNHLAFATFNDTHVKEASYNYYGEPGDLMDQYPTVLKIRFPKAGTANPIVSLTLVNLSNQNSSLINLKAPVDVVGTDNVLFTVQWIKNDILVATWTNRVQNKGQVMAYHISGKETKLLNLEEPHGWLEAPTPLYHNGYLLLLKNQDSGTPSGKFEHITRYTYANETLSNETDLTPGTLTVQIILGIDDVNDRIYYLATPAQEPSQRNLYSVPVSGNAPPNCISCKVVTPEGNNCTYALAQFSKDKSYYVLLCNGPDPAVLRIFNANHQQIFTWEHNEILRNSVAHRLQPIQKDLYVDANGFKCRVRLLLPPNFDEKKKYPVLVNVYAGPGSIRITDALSYNYHTYLTSNRSVITVLIDGRGSTNRGSVMLYEIYRALGTVEIEDQLSVTKFLQKKYSWIDANNTAIWGWSYGGFATAMALATDKHNIFKCGISVAPVSSWIYYDTIYTERYMGLPTEDDNLSGYNQSDVTRRVEGILGKKYMLIHGTGDDNVHYQHAMALGKALAKADIPYEQVTYTDEAHGLSGVAPHLYHSMDKFWGECFDLQ